MLSQKHIDEIKKKPLHTRKDIENLIVSHEWLEYINDKQAGELKIAIHEIVKLRERLNFYRRTTSLKCS